MACIRVNHLYARVFIWAFAFAAGPFRAAPAGRSKGGKPMPDYEKMYFMLTSEIADAIEALDKTSRELKITQIGAEELYIACEEEQPT